MTIEKSGIENRTDHCRWFDTPESAAICNCFCNREKTSNPTKAMKESTSLPTETVAVSGSAPTRRAPRKAALKNLIQVEGTWHFRRMLSGEIENFSLKTTDLRLAKERRDAHLRATHGRTLAQIRGESLARELSTVEGATERFLEEKRKLGARPATLTGYAMMCRLFPKNFPGMDWQRLSASAFDKWIRNRYESPVSAASCARHLRVLFRWANEAHALKNLHLVSYRYKRPLCDTAVEFLGVDECRRLLRHADSSALPPILLGLFAGIRPDEVSRLKWSAIDWSEKIIRIDADVSKTRTPRNIENIPDTLWRQLKPWEKETSGFICRWPRKPIEKARDDASLTRWPHDALRHTFATYYCAHTGNPGVVAYALGHSNLSMLTRHYNGVAKKSEAAEFFSL